jgi:hypothetical protein
VRKTYAVENFNRLKFNINAVDRAGVPWIVDTLPALAALRYIDDLRAATPLFPLSKIFWIDDPEDPEAGDVQSALEEMFIELEETGVVDSNWEVI